MWKNVFHLHRGSSANAHRDFSIDHVFLDSKNRLAFEENQLEGMLEKPLPKSYGAGIIAVLLICIVIIIARLIYLQGIQSSLWKEKAINNKLNETILFADRGVIYDRNARPIAWNEATSTEEFKLRVYDDIDGIAHIIGFVSKPKKDPNGFYSQLYYEGREGIERVYQQQLQGKHGKIMKETTAGKRNNEDASMRVLPIDGTPIYLTIDSTLQEALYTSIRDVAIKNGYKGGSGVILDIYSGEVLAITSYPEKRYDKEKEDNSKEGSSFNRALFGLYTPGSIVKPFVALAALNEGVIDEWKKIESVRTIKIPNPYNPQKPTIFHDWKAYGWIDIKEALSFSSNIFFFSVTGGLNGQKGIGINTLYTYMKAFGVGDRVEIEGFGGVEGIVPNQKWKKKNFNGDAWRLGDTFTTSIGQYGFQVTALSMVRSIAAIANKGILVDPIITKTSTPKSKPVSYTIPVSYYSVVHTGMRRAVNQEGTAQILNVPYVEIAAKTGTAELGSKKQLINSWVVGFFPYTKPKYAFAIVLERAPKNATAGSPSAARKLFDRMKEVDSIYIGGTGVSLKKKDQTYKNQPKTHTPEQTLEQTQEEIIGQEVLIIE